MTGVDSHSNEVAAEHLASAGTIWKKSSRSTHSGNCVEVAELPEGVVGVRDSKDTGPGSGVLVFSRGAWGCFLVGIKAGEFDLS